VKTTKHALHLEPPISASPLIFWGLQKLDREIGTSFHWPFLNNSTASKTFSLLPPHANTPSDSGDSQQALTHTESTTSRSNNRRRKKEEHIRRKKEADDRQNFGSWGFSA
jgi:hypothetical protein